MRQLSRDEARRLLLSHHGLGRSVRGPGAIVGVLGSLGCIQLDPLDAIGTNADLVVMARVAGAKRGDVYEALLPGHAFEHFAKERCLLPAAAFPQYREQAIETPWWRSTERAARVPEAVLDDVYAEVARRGPIGASDLEDHGVVRPLDWSGWKGTGRMTTMALEVLWTRCRIVVAGRGPDGSKRYDLPSRALPDHHDKPAEPFDRWALLSRVRSAGLLARAGGPCWSMLRDVRTSPLPDALIEEGLLEEVTVEGSRRPYLRLRGERFGRPRDDGRMRILGPLDPLLWDRKLVEAAFGFEYVWEVYKPQEARRWGWYVCPLLHRGRLVGRLEARARGDLLDVSRVWREENDFDEDALDDALARHAAGCGASAVRRGAGARR